VAHSIPHVLKSLTYFDDAEKDPMPDMLASVSWDELKAVLHDRGAPVGLSLRVERNCRSLMGTARMFPSPGTVGRTEHAGCPHQ